MKKKLIPGSCLYAIIDRASHPALAAEIARDCLQAGVKIVQLRDKTEDTYGFYKDALLIRKITSGKALFIINDRADIARLSGADGLHLGQSDFPVKAARRLLGENRIVGKSCHSLEQAIAAEKEGVDYISIGPIFKTPTKPEYLPVGLRLLEEARQCIKIPIVAIGGINTNNIKLVREAGGSIIAAARAICNAKDIVKAVRELE